jgi:ornithine carbamoyltransferase
MGRSLLITGAVMGPTVRLVVPQALRPSDDVVQRAHALATASGARITITDDVAEGVVGADSMRTVCRTRSRCSTQRVGPDRLRR